MGAITTEGFPFPKNNAACTFLGAEERVEEVKDDVVPGEEEEEEEMEEERGDA